MQDTAAESRSDSNRRFNLGAAWALLAAVTGAITLMRPSADQSGQQPDPELTEKHFQVDINRASAAEFQALPEIGPKMAERIVEHRSNYGEFLDVERLDGVPGIGEKTLAQLREYLWTDSPKPRQDERLITE